MNITFLKQTPGCTRLILILTGWSTGPDFYSSLSVPAGWDVAVGHGFDSPEVDGYHLDGYYTIYLFAWSLGVYAAEFIPHPERITEAFAINGTSIPVSDTEGIPERIFRATAENLNPVTLRKFRRRMMPSSDLFHLFFPSEGSSHVDTASLATELFSVLRSSPQPGRLQWTRAYISGKDAIFPADNMQRFWEKFPDTEICSLPEDSHWTDMGTIIRSVIADPEKVSKRFAGASDSYDTHAIAQRAAAVHLAFMLDDMKPEKGGPGLEIGPGTGLFTREYASRLHPSKMTFVDIAPTGPHNIAPIEEYHCMDAEKFMEHNGETYAYILSASAIQWFADIPRFLRNCARTLQSGGILALSTFLPGNMEELDMLRPSPLRYPTTQLLAEAVKEDFSDIILTSEEIRVEFRSVREMLMHLKHTGVGGSAPGTLPISALRQISTLTYKPLYLTARRR